MKKQKDSLKVKRIFSIVLITLAACAIFYFATNPFSLADLQAHKDDIATLYTESPILFTLGFIVIYAVCTAFSLPIATLLSLLAGFVFGNILGTFSVVIGATIGAALIFMFARMAAGDVLKKRAGKLYKKIEQPFTENPVSYLLFMRLVPLFPFVLVNIVPALFNMRLSTYVWVTFIGIIPGTFVYVNVGTSLASIQSTADIFSTEVLIAFTLLGLFSLTPAIISKYKKRG